MKKQKSLYLQELKDKLVAIREYGKLVKGTLEYKVAAPILDIGIFNETGGFFDAAELINKVIQNKVYETIAKIEMVEHPTKLAKPISEMSYDELLFHNEKATALQEKRKSIVPIDLPPHRTPLEEFLVQISKRSGDIGSENANYNATVTTATSLLTALPTLTAEERRELDEAFNNAPIPNTPVGIDIVVESKT